MRLETIGLALLLAAGAARGQPAQPNPNDADAPPPALRTHGLIPLEVGGGTQLRYGVDPASISIARDGVVRYVVVATSPSGTVNAMYEGLRCGSDEVTVYARYLPGSGWSRVADPQWQQLQDMRSRHSLAVARAGACVDDAPNHSAADVVHDLRAPPQDRFGAGTY